MSQICLTKCVSLVQQKTVITKQGDFITKFDSYCKMRRYSLISLFHQFNLNIGDFV